MPVPLLPAGFEYHFFVSYTTREAEVQEALPTIDDFVNRLQRAGLRAAPVFFDRFSIGQWTYSDDGLRSLLARALQDSVCMLSFVSPSYPDSSWCQLEWRSMAAQEPRMPYTLPIVWKDLGQAGWESTHRNLDLKPLPPRLRIIYPSHMHYFIPPKYELNSKHWPTYFPIEVFEDQVGWQRALEESYDFICHRTEALRRSKRDRLWWLGDA